MIQGVSNLNEHLCEAEKIVNTISHMAKYKKMQDGSPLDVDGARKILDEASVKNSIYCMTCYTHLIYIYICWQYIYNLSQHLYIVVIYICR